MVNLDTLRAMIRSCQVAYNEPRLRLLSAIWAVIFYLIEPDAALIAVFILVALDLVTKLAAISLLNGGFVDAVRQGRITSKQAFAGTCIKLVAYLSLGIMAVQVRYVALGDLAVSLSKAVVYGFLFVVEAISILENISLAGLSSIGPILEKLKYYHVNQKTDL